MAVQCASFVLCRDWLLSSLRNNSSSSSSTFTGNALLSVIVLQKFVPGLSNDKERGFCELIDDSPETELFK